MSLKTRDPWLCLRRPRGGLCVLALFLAGLLTVAAAEDKKHDFEIPAGPAESTLRMFAEQAGTQFVFSADKVRGVRTNALKGEYTPRVALNLLVAGTDLRVVEDDVTGALTVGRIAAAKISEETNLGKKKIQ
jgi:hypothetical protein